MAKADAAAATVGAKRTVRRRPSPLTPDKLTTLDTTIMAALNEHRILTTAQVVSLTASPERTVDYRLTRLISGGLVSHTRPYVAKGSAPYHWWLTRRGATLVSGVSPAPGKAAPNPIFLRHTVSIAGLYVALKDVGPAVGIEVTQYQRDETCWEEWETRLSSRPERLRPDGYLRLGIKVDGEVGEATAFIEIDCATMDQRRLAAKVTRHRAYNRDRVWWGRHPGCPLLLLVTTTEARVSNFLGALERSRPKRQSSSGWDDDDAYRYDETVAACAAVDRPGDAVASPVWRTAVDCAPQVLSGILSAEVRKYRSFVACAEAENARRRAANEAYARRVRLERLGKDRSEIEALLDACCPRAARAFRFYFHAEASWNIKDWAVAQRHLAEATAQWWDEVKEPAPLGNCTHEMYDDGYEHDGHNPVAWVPPVPEEIVDRWSAIHDTFWAAQLHKVFTENAEALEVGDPRLRAPLAILAGGDLLESRQLYPIRAGAEAMNGKKVQSEAAASYFAWRERCVNSDLHAMSLFKRMRASREEIAQRYDRDYKVVCVGCGIWRLRPDLAARPYWERNQEPTCLICEGHLVRQASDPAIPIPICDSLAKIEERVAATKGQRR